MFCRKYEINTLLNLPVDFDLIEELRKKFYKEFIKIVINIMHIWIILRIKSIKWRITVKFKKWVGDF